MHKCMLCDNTSNNTKVNRPVVLYHEWVSIGSRNLLAQSWFFNHIIYMVHYPGAEYYKIILNLFSVIISTLCFFPNLTLTIYCFHWYLFEYRFPKNEYMKRKWLKVFGIDRCHDGQRICSDHFLKEL